MTNKEKYLSQSRHLLQLPVFFQPWWLDTVCKSWDVAIEEKDHKMLAVYPYSIEKIAGITLIRPAPLTAFSGPLIIENNDQPRETLINNLLGQLPRHGYIRFTTPPSDDTDSYPELPGFIKAERITYQIALGATEAELFHNLDGKRRNDIRKATADLRVESAPLNVHDFSEWQQKMFDTKKVKNPYGLLMLESVFQAAKQHRASLSLSAFDEQGNCYGAIWLLYNQEVMYYMLSATHPQHRHRGAISLLIWHALVKANKMGLKIFDFEGSQDPGISEFFRKFGGQQKKYYSFEKTSAPLWKLKRKIFG